MSSAAAPHSGSMTESKPPPALSGAELAMQDVGLRQEKKAYGSKVKTRVGRYALYEFLVSACLLIVAAAADASNGQSGRLIVAHAGVPPIHLWIVRPILGFVAVALSTGVWRYKKCLNQYWLYRHFTAQVLLVAFSLWSAISTCMSISKFDVLNETSGFNYNLRVQMFFGAFFSVLLACIGVAYLVSTHRNFTAYLAYEFDPQVDGFTDDDQYKLRGGRFWLRVLGCKRLPKEKREILQELELDAMHTAAAAAAARDVEIGFESSSGSDSDSSGSSGDGSSVEYASPADSPAAREHKYRAVSDRTLQAPSTPPLASAPPMGAAWGAGQLQMPPLDSIENEDLPIASPRPSTPPMVFGAGEDMAPVTPPLVDDQDSSPGTPPMLDAHPAVAVGGAIPPATSGAIPHDEYEELWDTYPRLGGFKADVSLNPSLGAICEHLQRCNLQLAASGASGGSSTVFAHVAQLQPGESAQCLVKVQFDHENQHLKTTFKGPAGLDVSSIAASLQLGQLFGSIGEA